MEDLIKCDGGDCLLRFHCLRFTKRSRYKEEMYFEATPCNKDLKDCFYFWNQNAEDLFTGVEILINPTN